MRASWLAWSNAFRIALRERINTASSFSLLRSIFSVTSTFWPPPDLGPPLFFDPAPPADSHQSGRTRSVISVFPTRTGAAAKAPGSAEPLPRKNPSFASRSSIV